MRIRLGHIDYLNTFPVFFGLEAQGLTGEFDLVKGPPTLLNRLFLAGDVDVTAISSIEYARQARSARILPGLSVGADGRVGSILLFSRESPRAGLSWRVALTSSSATSVVLLKILLRRYFEVSASFSVVEPDLSAMLAENDAALLIGDDALLAASRTDLLVTDLGEAWKDYTGEMMVYALWVVREDLAREHPETVDRISELLRQSKRYSQTYHEDMIRRAGEMRPLPRDILLDYFGRIRHDFGPEYRRALERYFAEAEAIGELERTPELRIWRER